MDFGDMSFQMPLCGSSKKSRSAGLVPKMPLAGGSRSARSSKKPMNNIQSDSMRAPTKKYEINFYTKNNFATKVTFYSRKGFQKLKFRLLETSFQLFSDNQPFKKATKFISS
jgi:hypothetical protein